MTDTMTGTAGPDQATSTLDALIIGAGVAGLYALHQLREQGLKVRAYDAAADVGGTWYWNRYPGARFDSEAYIYQYFFDEDLYKNWSWSQRFPDQPEIERWLHYVTDALDLRDDIPSAPASTAPPTTRTAAAGRCDRHRRGDRHPVPGHLLRHAVGADGGHHPGPGAFSGQLVHTSRYPEEGLDLAGKQVGVIGIGATGIQVIQTIASEVDHLTVFVRTPQYVVPMKNPSYGEADVAAYKNRFEELQKTLPHTFTGFEYDFEHEWAAETPEQRAWCSRRPTGTAR